MRSIYLIFIVFFPYLTMASECEVWFKNAKLKKGDDCLLECAATKVDMGTFDCPNECDHLCKSSTGQQFLFQISDLYPGLTAEERALAASHPIKMLESYKLSWKAEELCLTIFPSSQTNDASDACRHFVWAAFLYEKHGIDFSTRVLNAHEQDPKQPKAEKSMDLANNRLGQLSAEQLIKKNKFSEAEVLNLFKVNLRKGRLIVLKKSLRGGK